MSEFESHIKRVNDKLQQLLKQYETVKKENERLAKDLSDKKEKQQQYLQQIDALQEQVSILKAAASKMEEADKKEFEKRINQYLKDIDKCIGLLSN
jgi:phage host-nuclease inhibitor protein Gam